MLLQKNGAGIIHFTAPTNTPWTGQTITTQFKICDKPNCQCQSIEASFFIDDMALGDSLIDLINEKFLHPKTPVHKPMAARFGNAMCENMAAEDWRLLNETYLASKQEVTKNLDLSEYAPHFPYAASIELAGQMIPFKMILPYWEKLTFRHGNREYEIDDFYCVRRKCDCTNVLLKFIDWEVFEDDDWDFGEGPPKLLLNYKTNEAENDEDFERTPSPETLLATAEKQIPNFETKITERHALLKKLYSNFCATKESDRPKSALPRIGRNEECPCGSGKKYKKCCGSVGENK